MKYSLLEIEESLPNKPFQRLFRLLKGEKKDVFYLYVYAVLAGLISLTLPLGIQAIINQVTGGQLSTSWVVLVILVLLGLALNGFMQVMQMFLSETIQQRIFVNSAFEFAFRIPRMSFEALHKHYAPELVNRFFDTLTVQKGLSKILLDLSGSTLQILFGLILLAFYHPLFILFGLILLTVISGLIYVLRPPGLKLSLTESKYKYEVAHWLEEIARSMQVFKLSGPQKLPLTRTEDLVGNYLGARKSHFRILVIKYVMIVLVKLLIIGGFLAIGSWLVTENEMNIGQFVAAEIVIILLIQNSEKLIRTIETIYDVLTGLEKIGFVTDLAMEPHENRKAFPSKAGEGIEVELKNLHFTFEEEAEDIIAIDHLRIPRGARIMLLGHDDRGKTHLFRLLSGFYFEFRGSATMDDVPLQNLDLHELRSRVSGYTSVSEIFDGSIWENITLGNHDLSTREVMPALKATGLDEFLEKDPQGLERRIYPEYGKFEESLTRRIVLTRALVTHPDLLLLHEPFEGLDQNEQDRILRFIEKTLPQCTVIVAATVLPQSDYDSWDIYRMENGNVFRD